MNRVAVLLTVVWMASAHWASAEVPKRDRHEAELREALAAVSTVLEGVLTPGARPEDASRLLSEIVRGGTADPAAVGALIRWVLEEKEERVARALGEALRTVEPAASGAQDERWNAAARSVFAVFAGLLQDAQVYRRRDGRQAAQDLAPLVSAAAPALVDALRASDPASRERLLRAVRVFAPAARDITPALAQALRHAEPSVRLGAATALGALGPEARAAVPDLRAALEDSDAAVREAAGQALKRIQPE